MIAALTPTNTGKREVGERWLIQVGVMDDYGFVVDLAPVITVTSPTGVTSTPVVVRRDFGRFAVAVPLTVAGRWTAVAQMAGSGSTSFAVRAVEVTTAAQMPSLADVEDYLGTATGAVGMPSSTNPEAIQDALDAETDAQEDDCYVPAAYPLRLRQALLRRVARNLQMRKQPLAVHLGDAESGPLVLPGNDPEVKRLEGPYRKAWAV